MLSSTRHVCVWFVHMHGCTIDCTNEDGWIYPMVCEVDSHAPSQKPSPTISPVVGTLGVSPSRFGLFLPPITPSQLPSIKLSPSPTPLCSLAVAISSLFLRSSSDSEICSFLGLRLLHQHPPLLPTPPTPCPHLFPCPLSLDLCLSFPSLCFARLTVPLAV